MRMFYMTDYMGMFYIRDEFVLICIRDYMGLFYIRDYIGQSCIRDYMGLFNISAYMGESKSQSTLEHFISETTWDCST